LIYAARAVAITSGGPENVLFTCETPVLPSGSGCADSSVEIVTERKAPLFGIKGGAFLSSVG